MVESARSIWGKILLYMKETGLNDLHKVCVNLGTVAIVENKFCIVVNYLDTYNQIKDDANYKDLVASFIANGYNYSIEVVYKPSKEDIRQQKIRKIEEFVGQKVRIRRLY